MSYKSRVHVICRSSLVEHASFNVEVAVLVLYMRVVQIKFKLCHVTQVLLKLRTTAMEGLRLLKLVYFTYKGGDILQTSIYTLPSGFFWSHPP